MEYPSMEVATRTTVNRLKRIEGQVRGVTRMLQEDRYCIDVLRQIQAVKAALRKVESEVLKQHTGHCVEHAIKSGSAKEQREKFAELIDLFEQTRK
jgi:CsoR family transcriptional regulator, copper-sensing transcriptional repressor